MCEGIWRRWLLRAVFSLAAVGPALFFWFEDGSNPHSSRFEKQGGYVLPSGHQEGSSSTGGLRPDTDTRDLGGSNAAASADAASNSVTELEKQVAAEIQAVASEMELMDSPDAVRRGIYRAKEFLGTCSTGQLTAMVQSLSDAAKMNLQRGVMISAVLAELAARDPKNAMQLMSSLDVQMRQELVGPFVFSEVARKDPSFLSSWLAEGSGDLAKPSTEWVQALQALAAAAPEAALSLGAAAPTNASRASLYSAIFRQLGQTDAANAVRMLDSVDPKYRSRLMADIAQGMGATDPKGAVEWLSKNKDIPIDPFAIRMIFSDWLLKDKDSAVASLKSLPEPLLLSILGDGNTVDRLQRRDPQATLDLLSRLVPTRSNNDIILHNLASLLRHSPDGVVAWLDVQTGDNANLQLQSNVFTMWAQQDPEASFAAIQQRPNLLQNAEVVSGLARGMAGNPLLETVKWSDNLPVEQRERFKVAALGFAAEKQPRAVAQFLAAQPSASTAVYQKVGNALARLDASEAKSWSLRQTGKVGEAAVAGVVKGLARADAEAASAWLISLPPGPSRNAGIKVLVDEISESDPAAAAQWKKALP